MVLLKVYGRMLVGPCPFELRRAEGGHPLWATQPCESYHAFDGSYGGGGTLAAGLVRPRSFGPLSALGQQRMRNTGFFPYTFLDGIPRSARRLNARGMEASEARQHSRRARADGSSLQRP